MVYRPKLFHQSGWAARRSTIDSPGEWVRQKAVQWLPVDARSDEGSGGLGAIYPAMANSVDGDALPGLSE